MTALRLAHRGDWRVASENTLAAMAAALANPSCDGLEFDVRTSADGVPVLIHDPTLARTHGRPEAVDALSAAELGAAGIPTLADILAIAPPSTFLDIELKSSATAEIRDVIAHARTDHGSRTVVSSFDPKIVQAVADAGWLWPRWLNALEPSPTVIEAAGQLGCSGISVDWRAVDTEAAAAARDAGLAVAAWTVRDRAAFDRMVALGVSAMCVEGEALDG